MIKSTVFKFLDKLENGIYGGWFLTDSINNITGKRTYPSTIIKYCKEYADISGGEFYCVDSKNSQWKFKKNLSIADAYYD